MSRTLLDVEYDMKQVIPGIPSEEYDKWPESAKNANKNLWNLLLGVMYGQANNHQVKEDNA